MGALLLKGEWLEAVSTIMRPRGDAEATEVSEARRLYCDHGVPPLQVLNRAHGVAIVSVRAV